MGSDPELGRLSEEAWKPTPVSLPGESHGQRSLVGYSPWGGIELDTTEQLTHTLILSIILSNRDTRIKV